MKLRSLSAGAIVAILAVVVAVVAVLGVRDEASGSHGGPHPVNQYAAKFICGDIPSPADDFKVLAPGQYNTAVNIHNPNNFPVTIQKKAVVAVAEPGQGQPSSRQTHVLKADGAMDVDCFEINQLLMTDADGDGVPDTPDQCPTDPGTTSLAFCKGYLIIEAATTTAVGGTIPQQLDVTDIITVKEEHNLWKDYTFRLTCLAGYPAPPPQCPPLAGFQPHPIQPVIMPGYEVPINWPLPYSDVCYSNITTQCQLHDTDFQIRSRLGAQFVNLSTVEVRVEHVAFASDARDVSLDFEFVTPKRVSYPCWPKGFPGCP